MRSNCDPLHDLSKCGLHRSKLLDSSVRAFHLELELLEQLKTRLHTGDGPVPPELPRLHRPPQQLQAVSRSPLPIASEQNLRQLRSRLLREPLCTAQDMHEVHRTLPDVLRICEHLPQLSSRLRSERLQLFLHVGENTRILLRRGSRKARPLPSELPDLFAAANELHSLSFRIAAAVQPCDLRVLSSRPIRLCRRQLPGLLATLRDMRKKSFELPDVPAEHAHIRVKRNRLLLR